MALISGVNIPDSKRVEISLTSIFGVGSSLARRVVSAAGLEENPRVKDLTETQLSRLREIVEHDYKVEGDLKREIQTNIRRKIEVRSYQGFRHTHGLPVRGQRTSTNARGRKGSKRAVAGKRRVPSKK